MGATRKAGLASIERKEFLLLIWLIKSQDIFLEGPRISYPTCPLRMHLIDPLRDNQILACADASESWLSNGENPTSLSCSYQKLFKKYPPAFLFEMGSSRMY